MITSQRAFEIAHQWANYLGEGGRGMCFRSLSADDPAPLTEGHRDECITFTLDLLATVNGRTDDADQRLIDRSNLIALLVYFDNAQPRDGVTPSNPQQGPAPWFP